MSFQYFGYLMWRVNSLEKTLKLRKIEGKKRRGWQKMKLLDSITDLMNMSLSKLWELVKDKKVWHTVVHGVMKNQTWLSDWTTTKPKRCLLLGRKVMTNLNSIFKSRDISLPTKVHIVKAMVFPVVMSGCESRTVKKAECWRIDDLNCGVGEDSWESLGLQGDPNSLFWRRSALGFLWKEWC